jgi:hypothetical protein
MFHTFTIPEVAIAGKLDPNPIDAIRISSMNSIGRAHTVHRAPRECSPVSTPIESFSSSLAVRARQTRMFGSFSDTGTSEH